MSTYHGYGQDHHITERSEADVWKQSNVGTPLAADPHAGALAGTDAPPAGGDTGDQGEGE
ncbi:hypothetical protein [Microvirgula aerodenitrificans]|uniref:hypothetical protein n=1 Tax=Microvirgula aerodenitrificans TaxID=57480 RepID=UPI0028E9FB9F|nr:hypothetical protein [Microvirgula aerodenitrificans]